MILTLKSTKYDNHATEGSLYVDDTFQCYTLELPYSNGLPGGAISAGSYNVELCPSPKFMSSKDPWVMQYAKAMPRLMSVPNRSGILIHWGNDAADTEGCILVGQLQGVDFIGSSRAAFADLYTKIHDNAMQNQLGIIIQRNPSVINSL